MTSRLAAACLGAVGLVAGLAGCSSSMPSDSASPTAVSTPARIDQITQGKEWIVDSSGWWVPEDPTGCGEETVTCHINLWPTRQYKGHSIPNAVQNGDKIYLYCKAPTPAAIRSAVKVSSEYWYYAKVGDRFLWVPDIYVTKDNLAGMAEGVPNCPSNTPGIHSGETETVAP